MGLLDWISSPAGIGLLSGLAGGMAGARRGQPINSIGRGAMVGLQGYQDAQDQIRQDKSAEFEQQYKQSMMDKLQAEIGQKKAMQAASTQSAQSAFTPGSYGPMGYKPTEPQAFADQFAQGSTPEDQEFNQANMGAIAEGNNALAPEPQGRFDPAAYRDNMTQNLAAAGMGEEALKFAPLEEYGTKPFVDSEGNARLISKTGATRTLPFKGQTKEESSPYGQDLREWFAINGIDPRSATPEQLRAGYAEVNQQKDRRSPKNTVTVGGSTVINEAAREKLGGKLGADIGEQAAAIEGKYSALDSVREAKTQLGKGIYAGSWGDLATSVAKRTSGAIGSLDRVANTETYMSYIGNTVIPRLKEFGGNDSVEEMKYLQRVMGGDAKLETTSLKRILDSVEIKILRGIERVQRQQKTIEQGGVPALDGGPGRDKQKPSFDLPPNAKQYEGMTMTDSKTGKKFKAIGGQWRAQ